MIVGSDKVFAIENFYVKYLRASGVKVELFPSQSIFFDYYNQGIFNKLKFKSGLSGIYKSINETFLRQLEVHKPDIIWIFKGMEITPSSLKAARAKGCLLVNYNPDNPFIFSGKGSGNQHITDSIPLYDLHFTYNLKVKQTLEEDYKARTCFLPFAFDVSEEVFAACQLQEEVMKICFLGNPDKKRADVIQTLANAGLPVAVYGNDWDKFLKHNNISIFPPVFGDDLWKVLRRYRIQLNVMRVHNNGSHNMRTFEIPGIAGIQLAPDTIEHRNFFKDGEEIYLYKDIYQCVQIAEILLGKSSDEAALIRAKARARCITSGYSYHDRSLQVLAELKALLNE